MKALLCLLSDQHVPNLLSVHHYKPDRLVLIQTQAMKNRGIANHFRQALRLGGVDFKDDQLVVEDLESEESLESVRQSLQRAYDRFQDASWTANLTGGTKPMSIATYEFFKKLGGRLVYTNIRSPAKLLDMATGQTQECQHRLTVKEFLAGYGFESKTSDENIEKSEKRAEKWIRSAELLAAYAGSLGVLKLGEAERRKGRKKGLLPPSECFDFPCEELRCIWLDGEATRKLDKYEVQFLTGGWLEVFVWSLLKRHADRLDVWDVRLGMEIGPFRDSSHDSSSNDFDVVFMRNHGLSAVECKSGGQSHDAGGDVLYKVEAVTRQFRALHVKAYLVTTGKNILDNENRIKKNIRDRAAIYGCRIITSDQIKRLANSPNDAEALEEVFFRLESST